MSTANWKNNFFVSYPPKEVFLLYKNLMRKNVESWQIGKGQDIYKNIQKHLVKQTLRVQTLHSPPDGNTKEETQPVNKYLEMLRHSSNQRNANWNARPSFSSIWLPGLRVW